MTIITGTLHKTDSLFNHISLSSYNEKCFKRRRENQNRYFMFSNDNFENRAVYEMRTNTVGSSNNNMAHAHCMIIHEATIHTHTLIICNTYCYSTATMVARTRLIVIASLVLPLLRLPLSSSMSMCLRLIQQLVTRRYRDITGETYPGNHSIQSLF
jgi:hypothetical protein